MEKALSRFHTCTELLKVFAETVKNMYKTGGTDRDPCRLDRPQYAGADSKHSPFRVILWIPPPSLQYTHIAWDILTFAIGQQDTTASQNAQPSSNGRVQKIIASGLIPVP